LLYAGDTTGDLCVVTFLSQLLVVNDPGRRRAYFSYFSTADNAGDMGAAGKADYPVTVVDHPSWLISGTGEGTTLQTCH